eukprot:jgi/Mesvir1/15918/Mv08242-RA.1
MYCEAHGSCPLSGPAEKPHPICPPYDASLRGSRVALLKSLGATVQPGADYGIDVHGINVREPWVLAHEGLQCAIKDLTQDYLVVNFKGQSGTDCEFDHTMCYALGKSFEAKKAMKSGPRINCVSNHPLLGTSAVAAEGWHVDGCGESCTHGIFDVVEADPPHGATALSVIPDVIKSLSREKLEYWKRIWWKSVTYVNLKATFPLIVDHPITGEPVIYVHNIVAFGVDMDKPSGRMFEPEESQKFRNELDAALSAHSFNMSWEKGDFTYVENLLLLHKSWPESADSPNSALRVVRKATCNCVPVHSLPPTE